MNWSQLAEGSLFSQGLFVTIFGLVGVFTALIAFYLIILFLGKIPEKNKENESES